MENVMTMIESGSVILLSFLAISFIEQRRAWSGYLKALVIGFLFAIVGVVVMENSVEVIPGIRTDPRAAVVAMAAGFGGLLSGLVTAPILAILRLYQGGMGAVPGATYILGVGVLATLLHHWWFRIARRKTDQKYILLLALVASLAPVFILLVVSQAPWDVYLKANLLATPTNFVAALLIGNLVARDRERASALVDRLETHARIDNIASNAPVILFQMNRAADGKPRFSYVSAGTRRLLGVSPETLVSDIGVLGTFADANAIAEIADKLDQSKQNRQPWSHELECVRPDSGVVYLRIEAGFRADSGGSPVWEGAISDISEQKRGERMKDEFISTVSHELRTPLTSIRGSLGLVMGSSASEIPPKISRILEIANRNAERLVLLINDILDMQKIRAGQMQFELSEEAVRPLIEQALETGRNYAPEKGIRTVLVDDAPGALADIDPDRFSQVLHNLLSNAIKFSPKGGTIHVSVTHKKKNLRISIRDEGPGIPEAFHEQLFNRFSQAQTSTTRKTGGTGLGLNISKAMMEAMNGTLSFDSVEGEGATFHIDLPSQQFLFAQSCARNADGNRRILVCGADAQITQGVSQTLRDRSMSADIAPDIASAREMASARDYTALVFDASSQPLPDLFTTLRRDKRTRDLPFIVISGDVPSPPGLLGDSHSGIIDWLERPLDQERLNNAIEKAFLSIDTVSPRVLHVEDDQSIREVMRQSLGTGVRYCGAVSLAAARQEIAKSDFDLVLLDLDLPDGSGIDLLPVLPADAPVVIFSAFEVPPEIVDRVLAVMVKSRVRETDVAQAVLDALPEKAARTELEIRFA